MPSGVFPRPSPEVRFWAKVERGAGCYKATREDGRDFYSGSIDYGAALASGEVIRHPVKVRDRRENDASTYLSVSVEPADCTGFRWPCRLFRVEPVGTVLDGMDYPNKRGVSRLRVVEELPAHMAFGPNGERVVAFLARLASLTPEQARKLDAAWDAARVAAWDAARVAAWAIVVRDLITAEQYALLVKPFVDAGLGEWVA